MTKDFAFTVHIREGADERNKDIISENVMFIGITRYDFVKLHRKIAHIS